MRVILDTNVFISALLGGELQAVMDAWRAGDFQLIVTDEIVHEYFTVLRRPRFALPPDLVDDILAYVFRRAVFLTPLQHLRVVEADPSDDKFLEAAIAGSTDLIVSGDRHLLSLGAYQHIPIITAREFLRRLNQLHQTK
jgi:putative PIN family toxin of toxin-antitoxin system